MVLYLQPGIPLDIELQRDPDEPLGATPNNEFVIVKVQPGTVADGKLRVGDVISKINGRSLKNDSDMPKLLAEAGSYVRLTVLRDNFRAEQLQNRSHIPQDLEQLIVRRQGFSYLQARLEQADPTQKLGLGLRHFRNCVLVSRCERKSLAAKFLRLGDRILYVDGFSVSDKNVARKLILSAFTRKGFVVLTIERPESAEGQVWAQEIIENSHRESKWNSETGGDVRQIARKAHSKLQEPQGPSILKTGTSNHHVIFDETVTEHSIGCDIRQ